MLLCFLFFLLRLPAAFAIFAVLLILPLLGLFRTWPWIVISWDSRLEDAEQHE